MVIGASGFAGSYLLAALRARGHWVEGTYRHRPGAGLSPLDITDRPGVSAFIRAAAPDIIFLPAAAPNVDWCETHPRESARINVGGPANVVEAASRADARMVYFSTEYVFDGTGTGGPYSETDIPRPRSAYGRQKLAAEGLVLALDARGLVIRTTVIYGWEDGARNFVHRLILALTGGQSVRVPVDQVSSPTYVADLARATTELAESEAFGIYNVAGEERASRYVLALAAARVFELDASLIVPAPTRELGQRAPRPLLAGLAADKTRRRLGWAPVGFSRGLVIMKEGAETWRRQIAPA